LNWERFVKKLIGAGEPDPAAIARGEALVIENARVLDRHLEGRQWIVGDTPTLADLALAAPLMTTESAKLPVKDFVHIRNWFGRVQELEAWKKTVTSS
jgi:glutathione S-transferase